ncbi:hypothetical protein IMZ48_10025 [Candidatus Bathyarchaeota archaeon]|nr:hypothetical protein [Candidatus Bathyarchaeota archaeon]
MAAIPIPEPKKLSDEELKKYGIHMATRLQSEDTKGANWADIDEDEDDWEPESVTWADGTKITLPPPPADEPHEQVADPSPPAATTTTTLAGEKTRSPVPSRTSSPAVRSSNLASGKGLILKAGSTEKVSLVAKPPAPAASKSPWAPLPPVQRASPVVMEPPGQYGGARPFARDHGTVRPPGGYSGPREISADDFSRSTWRDGPAPPPREIYHPQAGRPEPAADRRGSFRGDMPARPSLLQRPHPGHHDPAEPSPAFQSSRPMQDTPYGRRRGSSNVSGGSGYLQRIGQAHEPGSMAPPDVLNARRGSLNASTDSHISQRNFSPSDQQGGRLQSGQTWHPRPSPTAAHAAPHYPQAVPDTKEVAEPAVAPDGGLPEEQTEEYQKRLMKEKREEAIKRRQEVEAREEAAKAERIRLKLEAMGPAPERKSSKSSKKEASSSQDVSSPVTTSAHPAAIATTPTLGSVETATGAEQATQSAETPLPRAVPPVQQENEDGKDETAQLGQSGPPNAGQPKIWDNSAQPPAGHLTSWLSSSQASRNVWGSPNNDRGLGNGTFDPDLGRVPEARTAPLPQPQVKGPAPIAPPTSSRLLARNQHSGQAYPAPRGDRHAPTEGQPQSDKQNQWVSAVLQSDRAVREQSAKERQILEQRLAEQGLSMEQAQSTIKQTWRQTSAASRMETDQAKKARLAAQDGLPANGIVGAGSSPLLASGSTSSQSRPSRFFPPKERDIRTEAHAHTGTGRPQSASPPPPTMDDHPVYDGDAARPKISLPPPQPVVKLPPARSPTTGGRGQRSEPTWSSASAGGYKHNSLSGMGIVQIAQHSTSTTHTGPQSQRSWQEKIYELTGRKAAAPKSPVVESASKNSLDHAVQQQPVTVSLPNQGVVVREIGSATSKPMAEECFEEQEMGSLPTVHIPTKLPADAPWEAVTPRTKPIPRGFAVLATTVRYPDMPEHWGPNIRVALPFMRAAKNVPHNCNTGRTNSRGSGRSGGRHRGSGAGQRGGNGSKRDAAPSHPAEPSASQPSASSAPRGGRGSYRGRSSGDSWQRGRSSQPATN